MNFSNIKKLVFLVFAGTALLNACKKADTTPQLGDMGQKIIRIVTYGGTEGNYNNSALILDPASTSETIEFQAEYLGSQVFGTDVTVTVALDDAARVSYNAGVPPAGQYASMPAAYFTLNTTTATIKAGEVFSTPLSITFDPSQFDPSVSYMVPISITAISGAPAGVKKASNSGTAFFHIIGNPLAGTYESTGYFYHPASPRAVSETKVLSPLSSSVLLCDLGDLGANGYVATFETDLSTNHVTIAAAPGASGGAYTQFDAGLPTSSPGYTPQWPNSAQCNNTYDPATKTFKVRYGYVGGTGWRVTEEVLVKQ